MNIGERIKELRTRERLTQEEVGKKLDVDKATVARYEKGTIDIKRTIAIKLAEILDTNPAYIMGWTNISSPVPSNIILADTSEHIKIPVIGRVAAGIECFAEENIIDYELVEPDEVSNDDDYTFLEVTGDSMEPQFLEGDRVLVRCQPSVDSGSYAVVIIDDENGLIKRVVYDRNWIELQSLNPIYAPRRFEGAEVERVRVFGLVKALKRKF